MTSNTRSSKFLLVLCLTAALFVASVSVAFAATLSLSPSTGVYQAGGTFTARVSVNSSGVAINASDATLKFDTAQLSVISVSKGTIFNIWTQEPSFSNSAGTISFGGGATPPGYTGSAGAIISVVFQAKAAGTGRVSFTNGSVLANDGRGTNVLTTMNGGTYTIQAATTAPTPEVITEYVPPANTPAAPVISSVTHPDPAEWYKKTTAELTWQLPSGITGVRTLLDGSQYTVPTKVYENPIRSISLEDLPQGESYFHVQFRNADGWGKVTHYRLAVDTEKPTELSIRQPEPIDVSNPIQTLLVSAIDATSPVRDYKVKVGGREPFTVTLETASGTIELPAVDPGYHTVVVEAFDAAGNSIVGTYAFTVEAFDRPVFTDYPTELSAGVIPVIKGQTRAHSTVVVTLTRLGTEPVTYEVVADDTGAFTFIPESSFETGVYELTAVATDTFGAKSAVSDAIRIAVQEAGYVRIGGIVVSFLSVLVPTLALLLLTLLLVVWFWRRMQSLRQSVRVESSEAIGALQEEFTTLEHELKTQEAELRAARKTKKLTKAEATLFQSVRRTMAAAQTHIKDEITDVKDLTD